MRLNKLGLAIAIGCLTLSLINFEQATALPYSPTISIISPKNQTTYNNSSVPLTFICQIIGNYEVNGQNYSWGLDSFSYSLDNQANVSIGLSNATLTNLSQGNHTFIIYGEREMLLNGFLSTGIRDDFSSAQIQFTVIPASLVTPSTTPTIPEFSSWTAPLLFAVMVAAAGLLVYHKKQKQRETNTLEIK